jgi:plasmid stability protein
MNITLSVDDRTVDDARIWAAEHGTSLNAVVRGYLTQLVSSAELEEAARTFADNARNKAGNSEPGTRFNRNEVYQGKRFGAVGQ